MLFKIKALFLCVKTKAMETNIIERFHKNGGYLTRKEIRTEKQLYQLRRDEKMKGKKYKIECENRKFFIEPYLSRP